MTKEQAETVHRGTKVIYGGQTYTVETVSLRDMFPPYFLLGDRGWVSYQLCGVPADEQSRSA